MATTQSDVYAASKGQLIRMVEQLDVLVAAASYIESVFSTTDYGDYTAALADARAAALLAFNQQAA